MFRVKVAQHCAMEGEKIEGALVFGLFACGGQVKLSAASVGCRLTLLYELGFLKAFDRGGYRWAGDEEAVCDLFLGAAGIVVDQAQDAGLTDVETVAGKVL